MAFSRSRFILCVDTSFSTYVERNRGGALKYESSDPSVATVSEDGVVTGIKPGTVTITASNEKETCNCTVEVEDYAYMGGADDRSLHRDIPEATTQYVRVYAYTDTHGQDMVLTYINYKIITNWDQYTLHNLTAGTKIKDPTEYYQKLADRAFGGNKLMYLDIISEITWAKTQILKGNCRYYDPNEAAESDSTSTDEQTQDGSETKTSDEQTAKPSKEETDSEETAVDKTKQVGSDGTAMGKGASAEAATKALTSAKGNKDLKGSVFNKLRVEQSKVTKTSITIKWKKIKGAKKYIVFAGKSGKNYKVQKVATLKSTKTKYTLKKFNKKNLIKGTYYTHDLSALMLTLISWRK